MDRQIVYPGSIPQDFDILSLNQRAMIALGFMARATFSDFVVPQPTVMVDGLIATQTTVPSSSVIVGQGSIMSLQSLEGSPYGSLPTSDNAQPLVKMGINLDPITLDFSANISGLGSGQSSNCLIQVAFYETDKSPVVLPYYNAAAPSSPYSGPANNGAAQNTLRVQSAAIGIKPGIAGTSGSQITPTADPGFTALYIVTLSNGVTQITQANIVASPGAPVIKNKIGQQKIKLTSDLTLFVSQAPFGSDTLNSGLSTNAPLATLQGAYNLLISGYDLNGFSVTIKIAPGNYLPVYCFGAPTGFGTGNCIDFEGSGSSTVIGSGFSLTAGCFTVRDMAIYVGNMTLAGTFGLLALNGGTIYTGGKAGNTGGLIFGSCTQAHMQANAGNIYTYATYTVTGNAPAHHSTINGGTIVIGPPGAVLSGSPTFSVAFAQAVSGQINYTAMGGTSTFTGSAVGPRYSATGGGFVYTGTGNVNFLPGSTAGTVGSGTNTGFYS